MSQPQAGQHINVVANPKSITRQLGGGEPTIQEATRINGDNRTIAVLMQIAGQTKDLGFPAAPLPFRINVQNGPVYRWAERRAGFGAD